MKVKFLGVQWDFEPVIRMVLGVIAMCTAFAPMMFDEHTEGYWYVLWFILACLMIAWGAGNAEKH